jgi:NAD(P)-dependent dehydrogenase (short-subunit alcohol dehydrogenase family)
MPKTILITGCSSGLGLHAARHLAAKGHHVLAAMRNVADRNRAAAADLAAWAEAEGAHVEVVELDVTSDDSVAAAFAELPTLDVIINNAGMGFMGPIETLTPDQFMAQLDVNLVGAFRVTRAALPAMRERGSGLILQVSSLSGRGALPGDGLYSSSKFGLEGLSESLRYEVGPLGIDVVIMEPGPFATDFGSNMELGTGDGLSEPYAHVLGFQEGFIKMHGEIAQDPAVFSKALEEVIDLPAGGRPLRVIPGMDFGMQHLNDAGEAVRRGVMDQMGFTEWDGAKGAGSGA